MRYVKLGPTRLEVSELFLGCMSYGDPGLGFHLWVLNEEQSQPFYRRAIEAGINFFETANIYSLGLSEEVLDRAVRK